MKSIAKDPAARLPYAWDWATWLDGVDDTIATAEVTVPDGLTLEEDPTLTDTTVTALISGGTLGERYDIVCQITTTSGLIDERTIRLLMRNR